MKRISGDFNLPEPVVIANGVVLALSTGENPMQTTASGVIVNDTNLRLLTDAGRRQNTKNAVLYAIDAKTSKALYSSGDVMPSWVHFSGLAVADAAFTWSITTHECIASVSSRKTDLRWKRRRPVVRLYATPVIHEHQVRQVR